MNTVQVTSVSHLPTGMFRNHLTSTTKISQPGHLKQLSNIMFDVVLTPGIQKSLFCCTIVVINCGREIVSWLLNCVLLLIFDFLNSVVLPIRKANRTLLFYH